MSDSYLAVCHKQIGDLVLLEPALAKLASASGKPVKLLTRSGHAPLISLMAQVQMADQTLFRRFREIFVYDDTRKSAVRAMLTFARKRHLLLREHSERTPFHKFVFSRIAETEIEDYYLARYCWDQTPVQTAMSYRHPRLNRPPDSWRPADFRMTDFLLLNSTGGWKRNRWSSGSWVKVLESLLEGGISQIVLTSGSQDWQIEHSQRIADRLSGRVTFLGGKTRFEEYLWLAANARMVLSIDGSAAHLGAAFGNKTYTLFFRSHMPTWHRSHEHSEAMRADYDPVTEKCDFPMDRLAREVLLLWFR